MKSVEELFQVSPFEPLLYQFEKVRQCVALIRPMLEAVRDGDQARLEALKAQVFKTEHEADMIKDAIRQVIPRSFFLPVYRGDLLGYLKLQDDMADSAEDIGVLLTLKELRMPAKLVEELFHYVDTTMTVCEKAYEMNQELRALVDRGFHTVQARDVLKMVRVVEEAEWNADKAQYHVSRSLFAMEDELKPSDLMLWWRVFKELGEVANHAEKMADRLRRMLSQ